jgi:hypothetical protein
MTISGRAGNDDAWQALCAFVRHPYRQSDLDEPWDIITTKPKSKQTRKRRMTVARAMKQATRAGVSVRNVVVKPDGVELQLGEAVETPNPWDSVQ